MSISDIITLVSLIIAIVAILNEKNRHHLLLKFHWADYFIFIVAFFLINYFVFYESFFAKGIYIKQLYFSNFGFRNPQNWAYLITISSLSYFFYKVWYSFYPNTRLEKVLKFYQEQIESNEIPFLLDLVERYHKLDIIRYIDQSKDYTPNPNWWKERWRKVPFKESFQKKTNQIVRLLFPTSKKNRQAYATHVLHYILNDPALIPLATNQRPYLFADIISHFKEIKRRSFPDDLTNSFLKEIINHKNFWLKKELKQSENFDSGQPDNFFEENRILGALLKDLSVADVNQVWQPFGDIACDEIEEERENGYSSKLFQEFRDEQFLWDYKTLFAIKFFKIIIIEALYKRYTKSHFWLFYYRSITVAILKTFEKFPPENIEDKKTNLHKFIEMMFDNLFLWLDISNQKEDESFYHNIIDCLGTMIHYTCQSPCYGEKRKVELLDRTFGTYCDLSENTQTENIRKQLEIILKRPCSLTESDHPYYELIIQAWNEFDKIPYKFNGHGEDLEYFQRLKTNVIVPLGLNPDQY